MSVRLSVIALLVAAGAAQAQFPKPGPEHELLKQFEGNWTCKTKMYMEPGKEPAESTAEYTSKMEVGGLFLVGKITGKFFDQEFHARIISGYDTFKKKYTGTWVDNMSPALYSLEGSFDKSGKVYTEILEGPNPMDGKSMKMRMVTEMKDKDSFHTKMYGTPPGVEKETLVMEILYTRKK